MPSQRIVRFILLAITAASCALAQSREDARITVNPAERFQFIQGFGVNYTGPYFRDDQKPMFDMLIKDLGATMFRVVPYLVYSNWEETERQRRPQRHELGVLQRPLLLAGFRSHLERPAFFEFARNPSRHRSHGPGARLDAGRSVESAEAQGLPDRQQAARASSPPCTTNSPRWWSPW